jgi:hypothetical protein
VSLTLNSLTQYSERRLPWFTRQSAADGLIAPIAAAAAVVYGVTDIIHHHPSSTFICWQHMLMGETNSTYALIVKLARCTALRWWHCAGGDVRV